MCLLYYSIWYFKDSWVVYLNVPFYVLTRFKTFSIWHDSCHNSYVPNRSLSVILCVILGVFQNRFWLGYKTRHMIHHKTNGEINNKHHFMFNETVFYTLNQYKQISWFKRMLYKVTRYNWFICLVSTLKFGVAEHFSFIRCFKYYDGSYVYLLSQQLLFSILSMLYQYMFYKHGLLMFYLISINTWGVLGFTVVHNEHTYNPSYVVNNESWNMRNSGILGSSLILVPRYLKYFTGGLEYHHIHHMNSKIPGYNLQAYHDEVVSRSNMFDSVVKLSFADCYNNLWLVLYDENKGRYITFAEADEEIRKDKKI